MQIGAIAFRPYVYNTNYISGKSLSRISAIPDDALSGGVDYMSSYGGRNENPLRRGESRNFMDILGAQMQMSRANAARLLKDNSAGTVDMADMNRIVEAPEVIRPDDMAIMIDMPDITDGSETADMDIFGGR